MTRAITTKSLAVLLSCALAVLHSLPPRAVYHCRVTGARDLPDCCCKGKTSCCQEPAPATSAEYCYEKATSCSDSRRQQRSISFPAVLPDSCGCCDVTYEEGTTHVAAINYIGNDGLRRLRELGPFLGLPPEPPDCLPLTPVRGSSLKGCSRAPPGSNRPLYILFSSLLS